MLPNKIPILQKINLPIFNQRGLRVYMLRTDLIGGLIQGNKWFKLKYNLLEAQKQNSNTLLTFGGAYSNHIYALAAATKMYGFQSIGVIRGERVLPLNDTLSFAENCGMKLHFVSREAYRQKDETSFLQDLKEKFGNFYLIPEGGTNDLAIKGISEILNDVNLNFDFCACSIGTGGTFLGLLNSLNLHQKMLGFSALKGNFIFDEISNQINKFGVEKSENQYHIFNEFHFGGFAKIKPELIQFINRFKAQTNIQLEPIYTGKMMYGLFKLIKEGFFPENSTILTIHTGGLQALSGFEQRLNVDFNT